MKTIFNQRTLRITQYALLLALFIAAILAISSYRLALAQSPTPSDDDVNAIARQLYCPVCENTPLDVCPTEACRQWRELIRQMLSEGKSEAEIKQYFVQHYGARVLGEPPRKGLNWLVYIIPPAIILAGAYILFNAMRSWKQASVTVSTPSEVEAKPVQDEYISRFEEEVKKRS